MGGGGGILEITSVLLWLDFLRFLWTLVGYLVFGGCLAFLLEMFYTLPVLEYGVHRE